MSKIKKILCMLLVCAMIITQCPLFSTVFAQTADSEPLKIEVTTDKSSYTAYGIAEITVKVTNTSDEAVNNISAEAVFEQLAPVGKNNETFKEIESLQSGESFTFSYKATLNANKVNISFFEKIILWFVRLFNGGYNATSHNIEAVTEDITQIKFGNYTAENVVKIVYKKLENNKNNDYSNSTEIQTELLKIAELNNGELPEITMNSGIPSFISGKYSDKTVTDYESAINSLNDIKKLMRINEPEREFIGKSLSETQFKLQQVYNNIPVYGGTITITTDGKGNIECLSGHYIPNININTTPTITENKAIEIVNNEYNVIESEGLVIYAITGYQPTLTWEISCSGLTTLYISAETGSIVSSDAPIDFVSSSGTDLFGILRNFETHKQSNSLYLLKDISRGITVYDDNNSTTNDELNNLEYDTILQHSNIITSRDNTWDSESVQVMFAIKNAVDFYKKTGTKAFENGNLSNINVIINFGQNYNNAFSTTDEKDLSTTYLAIGDGIDYSRAYDVLYHEFTHSIIKSTCNLNINESGAINESYADILGNLIEGKDNDDCWLVGEDIKTLRSLKSPNDYGQPDKVDGEYMHAYCYENHNHSNSGCDKGGVHTNSGIINNVAYLIWKNGISNKTTLAKLFVLSLDYMNENSNFLDCRAAILQAAKQMNLNDKEIEIIKEAFSKVGIAQDENWIGIFNGTLTGKILDRETNKPILDAQVIALKTYPNTWGAGIAYPNENGEFSVNLGEGIYTIRVLPNENDISTYNDYTLEGVKIDKWSTNDLGIIYLERVTTSNPSSVHGTVIDSESQQSISNVKVMLYSEDTQATYTTVTDESGDFSFENLTAGKYTLSFEHDNYTINGTHSFTLDEGLMFVFTDPFEFTKKDSAGGDNGGETTDPDRTVIDSGNCGANGDNVTWTLYDDGELVISGRGAMADYFQTTPWDNYYSYIKSACFVNGVTSIGDYAFYNCDGITSITISNSVTTIGEAAFYYCDGLTSVTIPNSVTSIENKAFYNCNSLTSVAIGNGVRDMGDYDSAFHYCSSLTCISVDAANQYYSSDEYGVLFNKNKTMLIQYPFDNITTNYSVPDSVINIGDEAFRCCDSLTTLTIGNGVTSIKDYTFQYCYNLTSITIGNSVTSIGEYAFYDCGLTSIIIPDNVVSIGKSAFYSCDMLTSVTIGKGVTNIGQTAFAYCDMLTDIKVDKYNKHYMSDSDGVLFDKSKTKLIQYPRYKLSVTYVIPNSVSTIDNHAFYCSDINQIVIPNGVTSIGEYAFYGSSIASVYYSGSEENWKKIELGSKNEDLSDNTFYYNAVIYSGSCGDDLYWELDTDTNSLTISGSGTMYDYPFNNVHWGHCGIDIYSVEICSGVTSIGCEAFSGLGLTSITVPDSLMSIGDYSFDRCEGLTSIAIPNNVTSIGNYAFSSCDNLINVTIPDSVTNLGMGAFQSCQKLKSVTIGNGVKAINVGAFQSCVSLTNITIKNGVTEICEDAFEGCSNLTSITIPSSIISVGNYAFHGCENLTDVHYSGNNEEWNKISIGRYNTSLTNAAIHYNS